MASAVREGHLDGRIPHLSFGDAPPLDSSYTGRKRAVASFGARI
jgi:hypothetical protein